MSKLQYVSTEDLRISFPAFFSQGTGLYIVGTDTASVTAKKPDNTTEVFAMSFDNDVDFWTVTVPQSSFQEGLWRFFAESDDSEAYPQFRVVHWGDYVDDIQEIRQAALGRWRIIGTQLIVYEEDGTTPFVTFDLLDGEGAPSIAEVLERVPV